MIVITLQQVDMGLTAMPNDGVALVFTDRQSGLIVNVPLDEGAKRALVAQLDGRPTVQVVHAMPAMVASQPNGRNGHGHLN